MGILHLHTKSLLGYCKGPKPQDFINSAKTPASELQSILSTSKNKQLFSLVTENHKPVNLPLDLISIEKYTKIHNINEDDNSSGNTIKVETKKSTIEVMQQTINIKKFGTKIVRKMNEITSHVPDVPNIKLPSQFVGGLTRGSGGMGRNVDSGDSAHPTSTVSASSTPSMPTPSDAPRYLYRTVGNAWVVYDLSKFVTAPTLPEGRFSSSSAGSSTPQKTGLFSSQIVGEFPIISSAYTSYLEEANRGWAEPFPCVITLDSRGSLTVFTLAESPPPSTTSATVSLTEIYHAHLQDSNCNLLGISPEQSKSGNPERVTNQHTTLVSGIILANWDIYVETEPDLFQSYYLKSSKYVQSPLRPVPSAPELVPPPRDHLYRNTRDCFLVQNPRASNTRGGSGGGGGFRLRKGNANSMTITDLDKVYMRTCDMRQREELFANATKGGGGGNDDEDDDVDNRSATGQRLNARDVTTKSTSSANAAMSETRAAFDERGNQLDKLSNNTEKLQNAAMEYRDLTAQHKAKLKEKASRWGLF